MSIEEIKRQLNYHKCMLERIKNIICDKYEEKDIDVIGVYLHKVNDEYVFTGSYRKHSNYTETNEKRYVVTLDEYFNNEVTKYIIKVEFNEDEYEEYILNSRAEVDELLESLKGTTVCVKIYPTTSGVNEILEDIKQRMAEDE